MEDGDWGICCAGEMGAKRVFWNRKLTGVKSRSESASVADVAASIRSSHLLPIAAAAAPPGGSAEKAFLPSILSLLE